MHILTLYYQLVQGAETTINYQMCQDAKSKRQLYVSLILNLRYKSLTGTII